MQLNNSTLFYLPASYVLVCMAGSEGGARGRGPLNVSQNEWGLLSVKQLSLCQQVKGILHIGQDKNLY
jgi:hypothetical protein